MGSIGGVANCNTELAGGGSELTNGYHPATSMSVAAKPATGSERADWDRHWRSLRGERSTFGRLASLVRRSILSHAVRHYATAHFPPKGVFVEAGCGTGEASRRVPVAGRTLIGLDLSLAVLLGARGRPYRAVVVGDLRNLPFRGESLAGVWNLGVLEHFTPSDGTSVLVELRRVLVSRGIALLFWPPRFGLSRLVLAPVEWIRTVFTGRRFTFFPDEVNRLRSAEHALATLTAAGFDAVAVEMTPRDAFIHLVVVGRKP